ncbi:MAG: hypothetical protein JWO87_2470 [Phycisphaerales bacterium]|nr:hypothetical protein [Phycisphaerales bacterium]
MKRSKAVSETAAKSPGTCPASGSAADYVPKTTRLPVLRAAAESCKGCDLYCNATQAVFGEGPGDAVAMFVGEQPGDQEDLAGKPFVGPAGRLLNETLEQAGIDRAKCYVTNAVKHFKFEQRGKRRIHSKPSAREVAACRPWLEAEVAIIQPRIVVALGATAAQSMMGPQFRITVSHGKIFKDTKWAQMFMATLHPSALLRMPDPVAKEEKRRQFMEDLKVVAKSMRAGPR